MIEDKDVRNIAADIIGIDHGNEEFIRQIRDGEQDDNWLLQISFKMRDVLSSVMDKK